MIEEVTTKGKMIAVITLSVIGVIIIIIISIILSIKSAFKDLSKNKYYVLNVNDDNKEQVILLLKQEEKKFCESIYKIEYTQLFPDDKSGTIYCKDTDNINLAIYDDMKESKLADYIYENRIIEMR